MSINKKRMILLIIILTIVGFYTITKASSFIFTSKAQKEIVNPGDEVIINLQISDIDAGNEGINVIETSLEYDKSIFESIEFEKQNNWNIEYNDIKNHDKYGKLLFIKMTSGVKETEQIGKIKLKLRQDLGEMETEIKLKQVTSNDGKELIPEGDKIIKIRIIKNKNTNNQTTNESPSNDNGNTNIPKTGQQRVIYIILGIIIVICIIILIYLKIRNKENEKNKLIPPNNNR